MTAQQDYHGKFLTLWFTQLKHDLAKRDTVSAALRAVDGVLCVEQTSAAGGLLVKYDPCHGDHPAFWNAVEAALHSQQLFHDPRPLARSGRGVNPVIRVRDPQNLLVCNTIFA